jgi:tetratricopeptide (TPR) repeat protein
MIAAPALLVLGLLANGAPAAGTKNLDRGTHALAEFRAEDAITALEKAKDEGPYSRADNIRLYEQLGIAYAYLDRSEDALAAFDTLLALDPGRAISYTLSPKVTFLFEQARGAVANRTPPTIDVRWPVGLVVSAPVPVDIEVVSDPKQFLSRAKVHYRLKGSPKYDVVELDLPAPGSPKRLEIPAIAAASLRQESVEIYLVAHDRAGSEVHQWGSEARPREISLRYEPPDPWYSKWWVWAIAGTVVAASASAAAVAASSEPEPTVGGVFRVVP